METEITNLLATSGSDSSGFDITSIMVMLFLSIVGYAYWRYGRTTEEHKFVVVAIVMWVFPYINSDPVYMIGVSAASALIAHYIID